MKISWMYDYMKDALEMRLDCHTSCCSMGQVISYELLFNAYHAEEIMYKVLMDCAMQLVEHHNKTQEEPHDPVTYSMQAEKFYWTQKSNGFAKEISVNLPPITYAEFKKEAEKQKELEAIHKQFLASGFSSGGLVPKTDSEKLWVDKPNHTNIFEKKSDYLPAMEYPVHYPCDCSMNGTVRLRRVVIHLNDKHQWTREHIADWLEEIHDPTGVNGPNINFG